jgi:large subunit ribosomal protein L4
MADGTVTLPVVSGSRAKVGEVDVPAGLVSGPAREALLHDVVQCQLANRRAGTAATKTKGFVSGGGKKPWKQKGTGRARAGSSRSPLWAGGGTIFGPQPRDYGYRLPKTARRAALRAAIANRHAEGRLVVVDGVTLAEPKTKRMAEWLRGLGIDASALLVLAQPDEAVERAARNLPHVKILLTRGLNVYDVLGHVHLLVTRAALEELVARLGGAAEGMA